MLSGIDRVAVAARYRKPVVEALRTVFGAEVAGDDRVPLWSAQRTTLRAGTSEIEVLEADGLGDVADFVGRRGPGLFAVGLASADPDAFRASLEARGASFAEHEGQLLLTSDRGVDLPGVHLIVSPAREREPVGLLQRLCGATLLHRDAEAHAALVRLLGVGPSRLSEVSDADARWTGCVVGFGDALASHLAILTPWDVATPAGRLLYRQGPGIHLASALSAELPAIREALASLGHPCPAASPDEPVLVPARLLGGARLAVFPPGHEKLTPEHLVSPARSPQARAPDS